MNTALASLNVVQSGLIWNNTFYQLGGDFFTPLAPHPLCEPYWVGSSDAVASLLGLKGSPWQSEGLLQALSGNQPISGTQPLASVYSGHQFGHWAGQLGDGRAILLGQTNGLEVQLKGSGLTPYSRMGDGRAVLRSSVREFLCSEAMHGLGIATTRALCVTGSDDEVWRESPETAAVVTRVAPSFIRFGHFEHFSARKKFAQLKALADYCIDQHYPDCRALPGNAYANLLHQVVARTAVMVAHWQAVGFCHGVMNTDNMSILGLTMDYGPFQFLDAFDPGHICNHSDQGGRYSFENQPSVANWNLYCLAEALMPLIEDQQQVLQALKPFKTVFDTQLHQLMCAKLGLLGAPESETVMGQDQTLWVDLLKLLAQDRVDYSIFWRRFSQAQASGNLEPVRDLFLDRPALDSWMLLYSERTAHMDKELQADLMLKSNPKLVLRNYLAEEAIQAAKTKNFTVVADMLKVLQHPFDEHPEFERWANVPPDWAAGISVSCSS